MHHRRGGLEDAMINFRRAAASVGAVVMAGIMFLSGTVTVNAWDRNGDSTVENNVTTKAGTEVKTTIQTNYHTAGATGLAVITSADTVNTILNISEEEVKWEHRGVLYVSNSLCGENAQSVFKGQAQSLQGEVLWMYDIRMFRYNGEWYEPFDTISSPVTMVVGILPDYRSADYDYAMVRLDGNGNSTLLTDQDSDEYTLTFQSDRFGDFAMIRYPKGNKPQPGTGAADKSAAGQNAAQPASPGGVSSSGELDEVPKTGDLMELKGLMLVMSGLGLLAIYGVFGRRAGNKE